MKLLFTLLITLCLLAPLITASAEADPNRLNDAIAQAAKSHARKPTPAHNRKPGAKPSPAKPGHLNLGGLGIVGIPGITSPAKKWGPKCKAKNPTMFKAVNRLCKKGGLMVPSEYMSHGWCVDRMDGSTRAEEAGKGPVLYCAKVGSQKKDCKPAPLPKKKCVSKLMQVCAKGGAKGVGKAKDGKCFKYQTGKIDYSHDTVISGNPWWNWKPL